MGGMFRVLYYVPDPASRARHPIAALVQVEGRIDVILRQHVPDDNFFGGSGRERFVHRIQQRLAKGVSNFNRIDGLGPYCELSDPMPMQEAGLDFVRSLVEQ